MKRCRSPLVVLLTLCLLALPIAATAGSEEKRIKAIDKLGFAVEEIDIVVRAADEGVLEEAHKQYKRAGSYFMDAMKGIRGSKPGQTEREQTEVYEDRYRDLDKEIKELDAETVRAVARLFHEAHEYFDPNA